MDSVTLQETTEKSVGMVAGLAMPLLQPRTASLRSTEAAWSGAKAVLALCVQSCLHQKTANPRLHPWSTSRRRTHQVQGWVWVLTLLRRLNRPQDKGRLEVTQSVRYREAQESAGE